MKTAVVVPTRTAGLLSMHLQALALSTPGFQAGEVGVVVVANGTREEVAEIEALLGVLQPKLPEGARIRFTDVEAAEGRPGPFYGQLCAAGADEAAQEGAEELVFANDDSVPMPLWLEMFRQDAENVSKMGHRLGLLGARSNAVSGPQDVFHPMEVSYRAKLQRPHPTAGIPGEPMAFAYPRIVTFCAFTTVEAYEDAGGFDEDLPAHNFSDDALSVRMLRKGRHNFVSRAFVAHFGSRTLARGTDPEAALAAYDADMSKGQAHFEAAYADAAQLIQDEIRWSGIR